MESQEEIKAAWCDEKGYVGNSRVCCSGGAKITKETVGGKVNNDTKCPDIISTSVYNTKPVHYLSMSSEELKWVVCEKDVYNVDTGAKEPLQFL